MGCTGCKATQSRYVMRFAIAEKQKRGAAPLRRWRIHPGIFPAQRKMGSRLTGNDDLVGADHAKHVAGAFVQQIKVKVVVREAAGEVFHMGHLGLE